MTVPALPTLGIVQATELLYDLYAHALQHTTPSLE